MASDPLDLTLIDLRDAIARGDTSSEGAVRASLDRIEALNPRLNAFLQTFPERALERAREIDSARASGKPLGSLAGAPVAIKDNMCTAYGRTTCASRILENYESPFTGTAVRKLEQAGAVIVGKTNLDEFAMGSSNEHSAFGPARNPWDPERTPGGSSGGSAIAVAARMVPAALGSDTGGSIRQPAGLTGTVGVKPTYGRVSRFGLVAFASSLDQIGPFARTVADAALMLEVICGYDKRDSTSVDQEVPKFSQQAHEPIKGVRLGVPKEARSERNDPRLAAVFDRAVEAMRDAGAEIVDIELPHLDHAIAAYYIIAPAEASANLARYDGIRYGRRAEIKSSEDLTTLYARSRGEGFGAEVQRRIMLGTFALSSGYYDAYYNTALKVRRKIKDDFDRVFKDQSGPLVHAVMTPTTPGPAFRIGEKIGDPLALYLEDVYTVMANMAGIGGVSIPIGTVHENGGELPVGAQLLCPPFAEATLLRAGRMLEEAADWNSTGPAL